MESSFARFARPGLAAASLLALLTSSCGGAGDVRRIGILMPSPRLAPAAIELRRTLEEASARRPWSVEFLQLGPERTREALAEAASRLVDSGVDVIFAVTTPAAVAATDAARERKLPVVFCLVSDPSGAGLVDGLAHRGGNVTGVVDSGALLAGKRLEYLVRARAGTRRVLVVHTPTSASQAILRELGRAAKKLGVELVRVEAKDEEGVDAAYRGIMSGDIDAVYVPSDVVVGLGEASLRDLVRRAAVPTIIGGNGSPAAVFGFGTSASESGVQAAALVVKILDGIPVGDLPVETPRYPKFRLFLKNAREMGYSFEEAAWRLADEIVDE